MYTIAGAPAMKYMQLILTYSLLMITGTHGKKYEGTT